MAGTGRAAQTRRLRALADEALARYDLRPARVRRMPRGWNATFGVLATDGARYALRVHRRQGPDAAEIAAELAWLEDLSSGTDPSTGDDLVVPRPHRTRDGALLVEVDAGPGEQDDGARVCDLLGWVDGHFVGRERLRPAHLRAMGELAARLQEHGRAFVRPAGFTRPDVLWWTERTAPGQDVLDPDLARRVGLELGALDPRWDPATVQGSVAAAREVRDRARDDGRFGLQHADLHHENVLFPGTSATPGSAAAIDFDDCGDGPDAYDLAVVLSEAPRTEALRQALLDGYAQVRPLPAPARRRLADEADALTGFRYLQLATYVAEHHDDPVFGTDWREDVTWCLEQAGAPVPRS